MSKIQYLLSAGTNKYEVYDNIKSILRPGKSCTVLFRILTLRGRRGAGST
jgi:hypothetical protein